jgi:cyclic pyranopterin phosphate synthase
LLSRYAAELKQAGLQRVNISLDTLKPDRFESVTRCTNNSGDTGNLDNVLAGIEAARSVGLDPVKVNTVVMDGINDDELNDFARKTIDVGWNVRFIELMLPVGVSTSSSQFISVSNMRERLKLLGELEPCLPSAGNGPAKYFRLPNAKGTIGFITPVSEHFCFHCNRLRLTSDGKLRSCLLAEDELDLRQSLRSGLSSNGQIKELIEEAVDRKPLHHRLDEGYMPKDRPFSHVGG